MIFISWLWYWCYNLFYSASPLW